MPSSTSLILSNLNESHKKAREVKQAKLNEASSADIKKAVDKVAKAKDMDHLSAEEMDILKRYPRAFKGLDIGKSRWIDRSGKIRVKASSIRLPSEPSRRVKGQFGAIKDESSQKPRLPVDDEIATLAQENNQALDRIRTRLAAQNEDVGDKFSAAVLKLFTDAGWKKVSELVAIHPDGEKVGRARWYVHMDNQFPHEPEKWYADVTVSGTKVKYATVGMWFSKGTKDEQMIKGLMPQILPMVRKATADSLENNQALDRIRTRLAAQNEMDAGLSWQRIGPIFYAHAKRNKGSLGSSKSIADFLTKNFPADEIKDFISYRAGQAGNPAAKKAWEDILKYIKEGLEEGAINEASLSKETLSSILGLGFKRDGNYNFWSMTLPNSTEGEWSLEYKSGLFWHDFWKGSGEKMFSEVPLKDLGKSTAAIKSWFRTGQKSPLIKVV